jgi:DNA polymerase-3 subunit epsilon
MRYKAKSVAALQTVLGGWPSRMRVEVLRVNTASAPSAKLDSVSSAEGAVPDLSRKHIAARIPSLRTYETLWHFGSVPVGRIVILDFETTGLNPDYGARVIEVSAREIVDGRLGQEFHTFADPGIRVPAEITRINGITTEMLRGAPTSLVVMREVVAFIGSSPVIGHNISFDRKFLELEANEFLNEGLQTICTLLLARRVYPGRPSYKLGAIAEYVGVPDIPQLHRASADTWTTAHLLDFICEEARLLCGVERIQIGLLHRFQRARIASARGWLAAEGRNHVSASVTH